MTTERIAREDILRRESKAEEKRRQLMAKRAAYLATGVWWSEGMNRYHEGTGVAHILFRGGALCGAHPHSMSGSFQSAGALGCRECRNCRAMLERIKRYANTTP